MAGSQGRPRPSRRTTCDRHTGQAVPRGRRETRTNGVPSQHADARLMRPFAPGWGDASRPRRRPPTRLLLLLVIVPLVAGLFTSSPVTSSVRADDLQNALDQKAALAQQIAAQKAAVDKLNAMQAALKTDIASTTAA